MYNSVSDNELLDRVSDNELATETLFEKYQPLIKKIARTIYYKNMNSGLEINDLIQEGMVGFSIALNTYVDNREATFYTFARMCIVRKILTSISKANRQKHQILNESISVENISNDPRIKEKIFSDAESNPERILLSSENMKDFLDDIEKELTTFESEVLELRIAGFTDLEISEMLGKDKKSIINATSRTRMKVKNYLKKVTN